MNVISCAIFRCAGCGNESRGFYFGEFRWGLPNNWVFLEKEDVQLASCSFECQRKAVLLYQERDMTVAINLTDSKEIKIEDTPVDAPAEPKSFDDSWNEFDD